MPGKMLTAKQVTRYMNNRKDNKTQVVSADRAGISVRSGRNIEKNMRRRKERDWKTRKDPFNEVWEAVVIPLLKKPVYQATKVLLELQKQFPGKYPTSLLRTLQRRMKEWRALYGEDKEVMFMQEHEPGREGISDFTHPKDIQVTIQGKVLKHIFFHFRLPYSGYSYVHVFKGSGESFTNFAQGLEAALARVGGSPETHKTDSLSACYKNLSKDGQEDLTARHAALMEHYSMEPRRNNRGKGHENGSIESAHRHVKDRIRQCLAIRGSVDFVSFEEYQQFIFEVIDEHNQHNVKNLEIEQLKLQPLPSTKGIDHEQVVAVVSSTSTIQVKKVMYTVPSKLIKEKLSVRVYHDRLECYLGMNHVITLKRIHSSGEKKARLVDFRHIISSLMKKPQAFRHSCLRDDLLPNDNYTYIWNHVDKTMDNNAACKFIVGLLYLAAKEDILDELANTVIDKIHSKEKLSLKKLQAMYLSKEESTPEVSVKQHTLSEYNELIPGGRLC